MGSESQVLDLLVERLPDLMEGLTIVDVQVQPVVDSGYRPDILVDVVAGRTRRRLVVEVKTKGEPRFARMSISLLREYLREDPKAYPVFAAEYVSERSRRLCRDAGVGYMDLQGNIYLRFGSVLVDRVAPPSWHRERRGAKQLFARKSTRVIRSLLTHHEEPSRITDLAERCDMTPGGVHWVVRLLEDKDYAERDDERRVVLTRPGDLLDAWAEAWSVGKNRRHVYYSLERTPEAMMRAISSIAASSGERYALTLLAGASLLAPFVRYDDVWTYITGDVDDWAERLDLRPVDSGGNIVLLTPYDEGVFMDLQDVDGLKVAGSIQLYVDLYNHPARGREQAEFLRERIIGF